MTEARGSDEQASHPLLADHFALREIGTDLRFLVNSQTGDHFELEPSQLASLQLADGSRTIGGISQAIGVPAEDVIGFFAELRSAQIVTLLEFPRAPRTPHYRRSATPHLSDVLVEITGRCNLRCAHCFNSAFTDDTAVAREMGTQHLINLISELDDLNVRRIQLSGGEPLLHTDLWVILDHLAQHRIYLDVISTNATVVTEEMAERLGRRFSEHGALYISMDGLSADAYDAIRGDGVFPRFENAIRLLQRNDCRVFINTMAVRHNLDQFDSLYDWMVAHPNVKGWRIGLPKVLGRYASNHQKMEVSFEEVIAIFKRLLSRWLVDRPSFRLELSDFFRTDSLESGLEDHQPADNPCKYALTNLTIKPDGTAVFCASLEIHEPAILGNVVREGLAAVWYGKRHGDFRQGRIDQLPDCARCRYVRLCGGGCRSNALLSYGSIEARDPRACAAMQLLERDIIPELPDDFRATIDTLIDSKVPFTAPSGFRRYI